MNLYAEVFDCGRNGRRGGEEGWGGVERECPVSCGEHGELCDI